MRKFRIILGFFAIILILFIVISLNYNEIKAFSKTNFGGVVTNNSQEDIIVSDSLDLKSIPPGNSSRDLNIHDVDFIIIEKKTSLENNIYTKGVIKICDFASISVETNNYGAVIINPTGPTIICKFIDDFGWFETMEQFNKKP
ncbi:MAG: hypothetical protein AB1782_17580 [Cyanobacteriota bacterium]